MAKPVYLNDTSVAGPDSRQGPPARRASKGVDAIHASQVTCAPDNGHMDARAEPMSVWGSDAMGGTTARTKMVAGAARRP